MTFEKRADAELAGKASRQFVLRVHRDIEVVEAVGRYEDDVRKIEERRHADSFDLVRGVLRPQRANEHADGVDISTWQVLVQRAGDVMPSSEELEILEPGARVTNEGGCREPRVNLGDRLGDASDELRGKE